MSVSYTQAGFSVSSPYVDTSSPATKNVVMPNIKWQTDYTLVDSSANEATYLQKSSTDLTQYEKIRVGRQEIPNIYVGTSSVNANRLPDTRGVQSMVELKEVYKATSEATGNVYDLPVTVRVVLRAPLNAAIAPALLQDAVNRGYAILGTFQGTSDFNPSTSTQVIVDAYRGDLTAPRISEQ